MTTEFITRDQLEASICQDSLYEFVKAFWDTVIPDEPRWNWHIKFLCDEMQVVMERVFRREPKLYDLIINIPPGTTKSTIASIMLTPWAWTRDMSIRSINGSYAHPLSLHLSTNSRTVIQSEKYARLFPKVKLVEESGRLLTNTERGQRIATSTGGSITGMHGHILIIDDPINPEEALSETILDTANTWIDQTLSTRKVDKEITPTILIMQRLRQNDPTGHMLETRGKGTIRHICLPAEVSDRVRPRSLRKRYVNGLLDPVRLSPLILKAALAELGQYGYAGQFEQDPMPLGLMIFRTDVVEIVIGAPRPASIIRYWDKAATEGAGAFTVGVKMGRFSDNRIIILDVVRGQWEASVRERIIKQTAISDGKAVVVGVEQEPGSGGKESAQSTKRNLLGWRVILDRPVGDKVMRADPFAVQVNEGNVTLLRGEWNIAYLKEMQDFCSTAKYKDQIDASSGAFAHISFVGMPVGALGH